MAAAKTKKRSIIIGNKEYTMPQNWKRKFQKVE